MADLIEGPLVYSIIGAFHDVYTYYGFGLIESVYAGALEIELHDRGHEVARELAVEIGYKGRHVCWQRLDMVVDNRVVLEVKAGQAMPPYAERQLVNYLRATSFQVGLLLHFGPKAAWKRFVDTRKRHHAS